MTRTHIACFVLAALAALASPAGAVPRQLGLTARVVDAGTPITGGHQVTVRLFRAVSGGTPTWTEDQTVTATDGMVFVSLGAQTALTDTVIDGSALWAEVQVDSTVLSPRLELTSAAYAIRAGVAEDAQHLEGHPASAFAASNHDHAGVYLPLGATRSCTGTQKVTGLDATGSVMCGADADSTYTAGAGLTLAASQFAVAFQGTGVLTTAARSDHTHPYLPIGVLLNCPAGQKVTGILNNGSVSCGVDIDTDTNTLYSAGTGLSVSGTTFSVNFAGSGVSTNAARADHAHATLSCPAGFSAASRTIGTTTTTVCLLSIAGTYNWAAASRSCQNNYAASLCSYEDIIQYRTVYTGFALTPDYWLGDRMGDNTAYSTNNSAASDDFDAVTTVTDPKNGAYCCLRRSWW